MAFCTERSCCIISVKRNSFIQTKKITYRQGKNFCNAANELCLSEEFLQINNLKDHAFIGMCYVFAFHIDSWQIEKMYIFSKTMLVKNYYLNLKLFLWFLEVLWNVLLKNGEGIH